MLKGLGITNEEVAKITGNSASSIRSVTQKSKGDVPRWVKLAIYVYEKLKK